ncbi:hypothetical protein HY483_03695 [Candidatus Woesearchaeota archaeon]|nr:hypothetical protein [Candidatus Woesearchaeota archaeon]
MTTLPNYETILSHAREESVRQIEDIFSNPQEVGFFRGLTLGFQAKQEHPEALKPDVSYIQINHNLANILYALTGVSCSPERMERDSLSGQKTNLETALAQQILISMYTVDQKRRIATVLKTTVRKFCEEYWEHSKKIAEEIRKNPQANSDGPEHEEEMVQLQQNKIEFIDYLVGRLEEYEKVRDAQTKSDAPKESSEATT